MQTDAPKPFYTKVPFIVGTAVLALVLIVLLLVGLAMGSSGVTLGELFSDRLAREDFFAELFGFQVKQLDYVNDSLDDYIDIKEEDYKGYDIEINVPKPTDADLENDILKLLAANRDNTNVDRTFWLNKPIGPGDAAYIYYAGYTYDKDGNRVEISGGSNYSSTVAQLKSSGGIKIGGGSMIPGFELSLLGKIPNDYNVDFSRYTAGNVAEGDVVYLTASYVREDGLLYEGASLRIDLGDENVEKMWGVGIYNYLAEEQIGMTNTTPITLTCEGSGDKITYTRITVNYTTRCEDDRVLTIEATFPEDYREASLRGQKAYFDIFFYGVVDYACPEYNDAFVTETLKVEESVYASYEGETVAEKYKNYRMALLMENYEESCEIAAENAMWEYLKEKIRVKEYPSRELRRVYENYYYDVRAQYLIASEDGEGFESIDEFARAYLSLEEGASWELHLETVARDEIKEKLIFYYIIRAEGLMPTDEEYERLYRQELILDFEYYMDKTEADYDSPEDFEAALRDYEKIVFEEYGEPYYKDIVYYNYATENILKFANVINRAA